MSKYTLLTAVHIFCYFHMWSFQTLVKFGEIVTFSRFSVLLVHWIKKKMNDLKRMTTWLKQRESLETVLLFIINDVIGVSATVTGNYNVILFKRTFILLIGKYIPLWLGSCCSVLHSLGSVSFVYCCLFVGLIIFCPWRCQLKTHDL